jgi:hypothetical protein
MCKTDNLQARPITSHEGYKFVLVLVIATSSKYYAFHFDSERQSISMSTCLLCEPVAQL